MYMKKQEEDKKQKKSIIKAKKKKTVKPKQNQSEIPVGSKWYVRILIGLMMLCLFILFMALAIEDKSLAGGFLISQSFWFLAVIVMLVKQILYMCRNKISFQPMRFLKGSWHNFVQFLMPVKTRYKNVTSDTNHLERQITAFRQEYIEFYEGKDLKKNVTQLYRHFLVLHKNRLKKAGISMKAEFQRMSYEKEPPVRSKNLKDGKFRHINAREYVTGQQQYYQDGKWLYCVKRDGCAEYDIIGAKNDGAEKEGLRFLCPACGAVSTAQELITGCPYCGKKFFMEELKGRICNLSFYQEPDFEENLAKLKIDGWVNRTSFFLSLFELTAFYYYMFVDVFIVGGASLRELPFTIILAIFSTFFLFVLLMGANHVIAIPFRIVIHSFYKKMHKERSRAIEIGRRNQKMQHQIWLKEPDFSLHSFFSNVRNKLAAIHFADNENQVKIFATANLKSLIPCYKNVVDCVVGPLELCSYTEYDGYRRAKVNASLSLLRWDGHTIKEEKERVSLTLTKAKEQESKNPFGIHSLVCAQCGASIDLLEGNTCAYCGEKLDFSGYDWCVMEYEVVAE